MPMRLVSLVEIVETRDELTAAAEIVKDLGIKELGFEDEVTVAYHARMASVFSGISLQSLANFVMELRLIKDETEIAAIKKLVASLTKPSMIF